MKKLTQGWACSRRKAARDDKGAVSVRVKALCWWRVLSPGLVSFGFLLGAPKDWRGVETQTRKPERRVGSVAVWVSAIAVSLPFLFVWAPPFITLECLCPWWLPTHWMKFLLQASTLVWVSLQWTVARVSVETRQQGHETLILATCA